MSNLKVFTSEEDFENFQKWVRNNPYGYIINTRKSKTDNYRLAHTSNCKFIVGKINAAKPTETYIKICSNDPLAIQKWFIEHKIEFNNIFQECGHCFCKINNKLPNINYTYGDERLDEPYTEGKYARIFVNIYERNRSARNKCIEHHGKSCAVCDFDFKQYYGDIGENFIHVHHIYPINKIKKEYIVDPIKDLIPLCPNCHAMIHCKEPALSVEELKKMIQSQQKLKK